MDEQSTNGAGGPKKGWRMVFSSSISLGNVLVLLGFVLTVVVWYARVDSHISDREIHQNFREKQMAFDERFEMRESPVMVELRETNRRLAVIELQLNELNLKRN